MFTERYNRLYLMRSVLALWFVIASYTSPSVAQTILRQQDFSLTHLGPAQGLTSNRIYSVIQSHDGAMWFSSKNGIDRYNGNIIQSYKFPAQALYSGASGRIIKLIQSSRDSLYAYDNKGNIFSYHKSIDHFTFITSLQEQLATSLILNEVYITDHNDQLFALDNGLYCRLSGRQSMWLLKGYYVYHISNVDGQILVSTNKGVFLVDLVRQRVSLIIKHTSVLSSYYDKATHRLWLGTFHQGVRVYDTKSWQEVSMQGLSSLPNIPIRAIQPFGVNTLLFGIDGAGVYSAMRDGSEVYPLFNADDTSEKTIHGNGIYSIYVDTANNIWIGSYTGGIDRATPSKYQFELIEHKSPDAQSLASNSVNAVLPTSDGRIYYATDRGVSIYHIASKSWFHTLGGKVALSLSVGADGTVFVGTYGSGVFAVAPTGMARQIYSVAGGELRTDYIYSLLTDKEGNLWIGGLDGELVQISATGRYYYPIEQVQTLVEMPDGRVAVGTSDGFYAVDKRSHKVKRYFRSSEFKGRDVNTYVQAMLFGRSGEVWIATDGGGLYLYNMQTQHLSQLTTSEGLPSNAVYALGQDSRGRILVSTDKGLALVIKHGDRLEVINIGFVKGLDREYKRMSMAKMLDGRFIVGSNSGAVVLDPRYIDKLDYQAPLRINRLTVVGANPEEEEALGDKLASMLVEGKVTLSHRQSSFSISFEGINYQYQHDILYQYRLEGFDQEWSSLATVQTANYTNVPSGNYVFKVRSISRNNGRVIDERNLPIQVEQPWWNTIWAWLAYIIAFISLLVFVWRYYLGRLQREHFNEKINFFINTAHDIRTPLSLILAPLSNISEDNALSAESRSYLEIARSNGDKLLNMVTQLLDFEKADRASFHLSKHLYSLNALLVTQVEKFTLLAVQSGVKLLFIPSEEDCGVEVDAEMSNKIFDNLLSNALKYTPHGGSVSVKAWGDKTKVYIQIQDTGIGIPQKAQRHIFENFYRADNAINTQETGSGLGLMLTRRLVELHRGGLTFDSVEGKGTTFLLTLPRAEQLPEYGAEVEHRVDYEIPPLMVSPLTEVGLEHDDSQDTLLFVDDNEELRRYIRMSFSQYYNVVDVPSGEEALAYLASGGLCDIVVSDIMMQGLQGDELCRRLKEDVESSWLPVILLTAKSGRNFMIEGLGLGADDYITKPFDTSILRSKIDSLLQNRRRLSRYYLSHSIEMVKFTERGDASLEELPPHKPTEEPVDADVQEALSHSDHVFIEKATRIVLDNMSDVEFSINDLCREMAMSRTLFYGRLKTLTGQGPQEFIRLLRLERSAVLIRQGTSIADAAMMTGFVNSKHFSTIFKKHFGMPPSRYVEEHT